MEKKLVWRERKGVVWNFKNVIQHKNAISIFISPRYKQDDRRVWLTQYMWSRVKARLNIWRPWRYNFVKQIGKCRVSVLSASAVPLTNRPRHFVRLRFAKIIAYLLSWHALIIDSDHGKIRENRLSVFSTFLLATIPTIDFIHEKKV